MTQILLRINELARLLHVKPQTLRFYEEAGLIRPQRSTANYRQYDPSVVRQVRFILAAKDLGFSLKEIAAFFTERRRSSRDARCNVSLDFAAKKLSEIKGQIRNLQASKRKLATAMKRSGWVSQILED